MHRTTVTSVGSILSALLASLCCIGPLLLAFLGAGSLGFAAAFEPYRSYLLTLSVAFLGAGFYFTYRKGEVQCADGTCKVERVSVGQKVMLWIAAAVALLFMFVPQILTLL